MFCPNVYTYYVQTYTIHSVCISPFPSHTAVLTTLSLSLSLCLSRSLCQRTFQLCICTDGAGSVLPPAYGFMIVHTVETVLRCHPVRIHMLNVHRCVGTAWGEMVEHSKIVSLNCILKLRLTASHGYRMPGVGVTAVVVSEGHVMICTALPPFTAVSDTDLCDRGRAE